MSKIRTEEELRELVSGLIKQVDHMKTQDDPEGNPFFLRNLSDDEVTDGILGLIQTEKIAHGKNVRNYITNQLLNAPKEDWFGALDEALNTLKDEEAKS